MNTESTTSTPGPIYEFRADGRDRGENPLVLGFAYSLTAEGGPGLYNRILAQTIMTDWAGRDPWIGVQWEIRDAMDDPRLHADLLSRLRQHAPQTTPLLDRLGPSPPAFHPQGVHTALPFDPITTKK